MNHDLTGIWAISQILPRKKHVLLRFNNHPKNPKNPFLTLAIDTPIDLLHWNIRRFAVMAVEQGLITRGGVHNAQLVNNLYRNYLQVNYPQRLRHLEEDNG
jgi:hypothetical protein